MPDPISLSIGNSDISGPDLLYFRRRLELLGSVFPVPISLCPGEGLRDAVFRSIALNGYARTNIAAELAKARTFRELSALVSVADRDELLRIVDILGIRRDCPYLMAIMIPCGDHGREHISFFGHRVRKVHFTTTRRVAPGALSQSNYQKALWSLRPLPFDQNTKEVLLDRCPVCKSHLGWSFTSGVNFCDHCPRRTVDLREFRQPFVVPSDPEGLDLVGNCLNPEISDDDFKRYRSGDLSWAPRAELFQLAVRVANHLQHKKYRSLGLEIESLEIAGRVVLDWPRTILELTEDGVLGFPGPTPLLQRLKYDPTLSGRIRAQVSSLINHVQLTRATDIVCRSPVESAASGTLMEYKSAAVTLKKNRSTNSCVAGAQAGTTMLRTAKPARELCRFLGLPTVDVADILRAGYFTSIEGECSATLAQFSSLCSRARTIGLSERIPHALSLVSARFALDRRLVVPWPRLLRGVFDGSIPIFGIRRAGASLLSNIMLDDFRALWRIIGEFSLEQRDCEGEILTQHEIGMLLGKSRSLVANLIESGFLSSAVTMREIAALRKKYVFSFELRDLALMSGRATENFFQRLHRSGIPGIDAGGTSLWPHESAFPFLSEISLRSCGPASTEGTTHA